MEAEWTALHLIRGLEPDFSRHKTGMQLPKYKTTRTPIPRRPAR
jgi:hypothetical protein